jgi:hypothetical protein
MTLQPLVASYMAQKKSSIDLAKEIDAWIALGEIPYDPFYHGNMLLGIEALTNNGGHSSTN